MSGLGRRLEGRGAMLAGLVEILSKVAERVMCRRTDTWPLGGVAERGCRNVELPVCLLGVAAPAGELRLRECQLGQRARPGDPYRVPLRLRHRGRARLLVS